MKRILFLIATLFVFSQGWAQLTTTTKTDHLHVWAEFPDPMIADGETVNYIKIFQHDDDDLDYTAFNLEIILPEGFSLNKIRQGRDWVNDIKYSERATSTHVLTCNIVDGVDLRIIGDSNENADLYKDDLDGNPLDYLFEVGLIGSPEMQTGTYTAKLEGIKFVHSNADARIPEEDPVLYTINVQSTGVTGISDVNADSSTTVEYFDLLGRRVNPMKSKGIIINSTGNKSYMK